VIFGHGSLMMYRFKPSAACGAHFGAVASLARVTASEPSCFAPVGRRGVRPRETLTRSAI